MATTLVAIFIIGPVGEWFIELAREAGWYENPKEKAEGFISEALGAVDAVSTWIMDSLRDPNWVTVSVAAVLALTAGVWADTWMVRRERKAHIPPVPEVSPERSAELKASIGKAFEPELAAKKWPPPPNYRLWMLKDSWSVREASSILAATDPQAGVRGGDANMYADLMLQSLGKSEILKKMVSYARPEYDTEVERESIIAWAKAKNIAADVVEKLELNRPPIGPRQHQ